MNKYQLYVAQQADRSRRRITALVGASYEEDINQNNARSGRRRGCRPGSRRDGVTNALADSSTCIDGDGPVGKKTHQKRGVMARRSEDGEREIIHPEQSSWYTQYVNNAIMEEEKHYQNKFRQRFRLPYQNYLELVEDCKCSSIFERWTANNKFAPNRTPMELLVLGALRYLGRGWTFDDLEESTAVSRDVHRCFFHSFIDFGSTVLYEKYVNAPQTFDEAKRHMAEFTEAGLAGSVGSSDCTNIVSEKIEYNLRNNHLGPKSSHTARTFSLTANHRKRILHSTKGGPARWNDQMMVRFDQFVSGIWDGTRLQDVEFELFEKDEHGNVVSVQYQGGYVIVDNGYLRWSVTVPPFKVTNKETEICWSKWVESMRKDVEDTFGNLKGRWRILKTGIRIHGVNGVDKIWLTCCALHNWLLDIDGLDEVWTDGVSASASDWTGEMGMHDFEGVGTEIPNAIARLSTNLEPRSYDLSGMGPGEDAINTHPVGIDLGHDLELISPPSGVRVVKDLGLGYFRRRLVEHFDILWQRNEVVWPKRKGPVRLLEE